MALISIIEDFHPLNDAKLLSRASELAPSFHHKIVEPVGGFQLKERYSAEKEEIVLHQLRHLAMGKGENLCLDFGTHFVGYLTLELSYIGSHPDAPAFLKLKFAETLKELSENSDDYDGWISRSWIQEEYIHVDVLPAMVRLPRRYAFRYLKITMMDTSPKYKLVVRHAECMTETSADCSKPTPFESKDPALKKIHEVSLRTLENCMQSVFEDGPKRDQRLWMGDFRLQALVNYVSFKNYDLVKRCLYLFGGSRFPDGRISACLFTEPDVTADDTYLFEYALLYPVVLEEYLREKEDPEALEDLYDVAMEQVGLVLRRCKANHVVTEQMAKDTFVDWNEGLDKTACSQAALIYCARYALCLAERKNDRMWINWLTKELELLCGAARENFWDEEKRCAVSNGQVSIESQIWMVLADVLTKEEQRGLMSRAEEFLDKFPMQTPYAHHYYVEALIRAGLKDKALDHIKEYWGSMLEAGADTFWEAWTPEDPDASPYGGRIINSYCHAWSCTPAYLLEKYFKE